MAAALVQTPTQPSFNIEEFLAAEESKGLLRLTTAGSVDDGKSTLIGRLLHDAKGAYEDQLKAAIRGGEIDFSLLTDGLRAEREQGITIDVAYRYFATPKRKFILADTPGHEQYTSTAELAIILLDAHRGLTTQSRRHAFIATLLGIPNFVIAVNKMDLVGYDQEVFNRIREEYQAFLQRIGAPHSYFLPLSALKGDNVVERGSHMPWFDGPCLLDERGGGVLARPGRPGRPDERPDLRRYLGDRDVEGRRATGGVPLPRGRQRLVDGGVRIPGGGLADRGEPGGGAGADRLGRLVRDGRARA